MVLDLEIVRSHFPAFDNGKEPRFFENAGGSFACRQTSDALFRYYTETKVQPYATYPESATAGELMDRSHARWAQALGVADSEILFGPSTSMNTYVLAKAFGERLGVGDEVIVTNQDHEANTGATRRMAEACGATLREWRVDSTTGELHIADLEALLSTKTQLVVFPHCSNIVGAENDVATICELSRQAGAHTIVDGVSYAPHGFVDVGALGADVYLFSMYKTYSVHQGLMVLRDELAEWLPNQSHHFNGAASRKRMIPAGPDHAQVAAAAAVLDYVEATTPGHAGDLRGACAGRQGSLASPRGFAAATGACGGLMTAPTCGSSALPRQQQACTAAPPSPLWYRGTPERTESPAGLVDQGVMASSGDFYAPRVLAATGVDLEDGVVRVSWVHYTSPADIDHLLRSLDQRARPQAPTRPQCR